MSKICPLTKEKVLYAECLDCEVKRECQLGLLSAESEKNENNRKVE